MLKKIVVLVLLSSLLTSCGLVLDNLSKRFRVFVEPTEITLARGSEAQIKISLQPYTGVDLTPDEAAVTLIKPPKGITADELIIPGTISSRDLTLRASTTAELVEDTEIIIEVNKSGIGAEAKLKITITQ